MSKYAADNVYTDAELLALAREAKARILATGQTYSTVLGGGNRSLSLANLEQIEVVIRRLETAISAEASGPAVNYARFSRS